MSAVDSSNYVVAGTAKPPGRALSASVLGVGLRRQAHWPEASYADSGGQALELLRLLRFDLVMVGASLADPPALAFARALRAGRPWQKWALVGSTITDQDEITARALGAMAVLDAPPSWEQLQALLRRVRHSPATAMRREMASGP